MITDFGQFVRQLRLEKGELLKDMAEKLQVTSSYLSSVERGRRNVPYVWADRLKKNYNLSEDSIEELDRAIYNSRYKRHIDITHLSFKDKKIIEGLIEKIEDLDDSQKDIIIKMR